MKKALSLFLSIVMLLTIFAGFETTAYAATRSGTTGSLSWSLDTSTGLLTLSGNGASANYSNSAFNRAPWYTLYRTTIKNVVIDEGVTALGSYLFYNCTKLETIVFNGNTVTTIGESAFSGCTGTTYWLDIPESVTSVGANAFYNTNFNYIKIFSPGITFGENAFYNGGGYARFFGVHDSGARAFVQTGQQKGYSWYYYCINPEIISEGVQVENGDHDYQLITYAPTCTAKGYDWYGCPYCDADSYTGNYVAPVGHSYRYTSTNGYSFIYSCTVCGRNNLALDSIMAESKYYNAISHDNDNPSYHQSNYNGIADIYLDGYVNARDFLFINNLVKSIDTTNKETTIDESTTYQTMEGFGASAAWWSQEVGGWDSLDEIMELLYGTDNGIGLNIYRYNLGGGSENDVHIADWRRRAEDFLSTSSNINDASTYDWDADVNARNALASAQRANSDLKVTLFSNSAPVSITDNGFAYCSNGAVSNLSESNYQAFANYIVNCAEHFIEQGYNITNVSPINEPEWAWAADGSGNCSQEGSHFEPAAALTFYNNYMIPALQNSSLNGKVELSIWESGQLNHSTYWNSFMNTMFSSAAGYSNNNANIRNYVDSVDTHSYWAGTSDRQTVANQLKSSNYASISKVRCTEYCQMTNDGNSNVIGHIQYEENQSIPKITPKGLDIDYGLAMADIIHQDLTILNAVEWDWWTACSDGNYPDGLIYINNYDHSAIETSKRLWCLGNYSKFIEDGAKRIEVSTGSSFGADLVTNVIYNWADEWGNTGTDKNNYIEQSAYLNPDGTVVVVYINNSDTNEYTHFDSSVYSTFETYVTDELHNLEKYQCGTVDGKAVSIPAKSVTTVILEK